MIKMLTCLVLSFVSFGTLCATSKIDQASVTLPYVELVRLLDRANAVQVTPEDDLAKPPVDVVVHSAHYTLECTDADAVSLEATFVVTNLSDAWQTVMLVEASEAIRSVEPVEAKLVQLDSGMCLLLEPNMEMTVTLGLQPKIPERSRSGRIVADFFTVSAAQSILYVNHHSEPSAIVVSGAVGSNREGTEFSLPSHEGPVQVKFYDPTELASTRWSSVTQHLIRDFDGTMDVACRVRLSATDSGRTSEARLLLSDEANVTIVEGAGLSHVIELTEDGSAIRLDWSNDEATTRDVLVRYTVPISMAEGVISMPVVRVAGALRDDAVCYFSDFQGLDLSPADNDWSNAGRLPEWIFAAVGVESVDRYVVPSGGSFDLSARLLPRLKIAEATIMHAEYVTDVVAGGGMLHQATIRIEHEAQAEYPVTLPVGGKLLSSAVNGRATEPILRPDGGLIFILPKAANSAASTTLNYVFTAKGDKMNPVEGQAALELPRTPLFIHQLQWLVHLTGEYQATALEDNVVIEAGGADGNAVRLSKQICDDESPIASLYYTRRDFQR